MATKLIELDNGILIEVETDQQRAKHISRSVAERVHESFQVIEPVLREITQSLAHVWEYVIDETEVEQIEAELGISFEGEGNVFVTKAKAGANIVVTLTLKPRRKVSKE